MQQLYSKHTHTQTHTHTHLFGFLGEFGCGDAQLVEDVGHVTRVDPAVVGHVLLTPLVDVHLTRCNHVTQQ